MPFTAHDYRKIIDIIDLIYSIPDRPRLFNTACSELQRLVSISGAALLGTDPETGQFSLDDCCGYNFSNQGFVEFCSGYWAQQPLIATGARTKLGIRPMRITDVVSPSKFERSCYYVDFSKKFNVFYECNMDLVSPTGFVGGIGFHRERSDSDFHDRDLQIIRILQPHFSHALYNIDLLRGYLAKSDQRIKARLASFGLSGRQQEVALWVSKGLSNRDIARRLFISDQTVKDHVSGILERLKVRSRSQITALALGQLPL